MWVCARMGRESMGVHRAAAADTHGHVSPHHNTPPTPQKKSLTHLVAAAAAGWPPEAHCPTPPARQASPRPGPAPAPQPRACCPAPAPAPARTNDSCVARHTSSVAVVAIYRMFYLNAGAHASSLLNPATRLLQSRPSPHLWPQHCVHCRCATGQAGVHALDDLGPWEAVAGYARGRWERPTQVRPVKKVWNSPSHTAIEDACAAPHLSHQPACARILKEAAPKERLHSAGSQPVGGSIGQVCA